MKRSTTEPVVSRKSVPLTERDLRDLERLRQPDTPQARALRELNGEVPSPTEAALLQRLVELGLDLVDDQVREEGYRQLAAATTEEDLEERRALRRRQVRAWADEE
jgi:hypothetical protein